MSKKRNYGVLRHAKDRLVKVRLNYIVFGAALLSIAIAELAWVVPATFTQEKKLLDQLEQRARLEVVSTIQQARFEDVALTEKLGARLTALGDILGGTIYDKNGNLISYFGVTPILSWSAINNDGVTRYQEPSRCCLDITLKPEQTNLDYILVLRLNSSNISQQVWNYLIDLAGFVFLVALITCSGILCLLYFTIAQPIIKLNKNITSALKDPLRLHKYKLAWRRGDEIGELADNLDVFLTDIDKLYKTELLLAKQALESANYPVLQFDADHILITANDAAFKYFKVNQTDELQNRAIPLLGISQSHEGAQIPTLADLHVKEQPVAGYSYLEDESIANYIYTTRINDDNGMPYRYIVTLSQTKSLFTKIAALTKEAEKYKKFSNQTARQYAELNLFVTSTNSISQNFAENDKANQVTDKIECMPILNEWIAKAKSTGLQIDVVLGSQMPYLKGRKNNMSALLKHALLTIHQRCEFDRPCIRVSAIPDGNDKAKFIITDVSAQKKRGFLPDGIERGHWQPALRGLQFSLEKENGKLETYNVKPGQPNEISFTLAVSTHEWTSLDTKQKNAQDTEQNHIEKAA